MRFSDSIKTSRFNPKSEAERVINLILDLKNRHSPDQWNEQDYRHFCGIIWEAMNDIRREFTK